MSDEFDAIVADIEIEMPDINHNFKILTPLQLLERKHEIQIDLESRGALVYPKTQEDMDLQAEYFGIVQEMRERNML